MKVAILGGGFGLYGYLPALIHLCNTIVLLPKRYQETLKTRKDICGFYSLVEWINDDETLMNMCDSIVIALPPKLQYKYAINCLKKKNIINIFLEKPLASNPKFAFDLLNRLESSSKKFRIGYNFRFTEWGKMLLHNTDGVESITWHFRAHHYSQEVDTWKRNHYEGGGALCFYGIHLISLLAELGYDSVLTSRIKIKNHNEAESWEAEILGKNLSPCKIVVNSNSDDTNFSVKTPNRMMYSFLDPFQTSQQDINKKFDHRIPFLTESLGDLFCNNQHYYKSYQQTNLLWQHITEKTLFA